MKGNKYQGRLKRHFIEFTIFLVVVFAFFNIINYFWLKPASSEFSLKDKKMTLAKKNLNYVAIGDSLTEGVGDQTDQGGFIPLLAKSLETTYAIAVDSQNFGVSGNTSTQIYKRMTTQDKIQTAIKKADLLTITVGGNDVMAVIRKNIATLSEKSFKTPAKTYQKQITAIFELIRKENPTVPVFVLGIYNPFYLNFPDITQMQEIVNDWNQATQEIVSQQEKMYFVPINDLLYQGIDGSQGVTANDGNVATITNDALFEEDHFHPNNIGYQIMSDAVFETYQKEEGQKLEK